VRGLLLSLWLPLLSVPAVAQLEPVPDPVERLDRWLTVQRGAMREVQVVAGPVSLGAGALVLGAGVAALADDQYAEQPSLAWLQVGVGVMALAQGAVWLLITPDPEDRYRRWRRAREAGPTAEATARFEGELRAAGRVASMERALYRWSGLGLLFGAAVILGVLPTERIDDAHLVAGYATAGIYGAVGAVLLVASFLPTLGEGAWRHYEEGLAPSVSVGPNGAFLSLSRAF
jgi:hypothetical protein